MLFIALRQMLSRRKQTFFTLMGIVLGAAAYVIISGVMLGLREYLVEELINNDAQIRISARVKVIEPSEITPVMFGPGEIPDWISEPSGRRDSSQMENQGYWIRRLSQDTDTESYSPQLQVKVFFIRGRITESGRIVGVIPSLHGRVIAVEEQMVTGAFADLEEGGKRIILGEGLRRLLGARIHDTVMIVPAGGQPVSFRITGSFQAGNRGIDDTTAYMSLSDAQALNRTPGRISDISVRLKNVDLAAAKAAEWSADESVRVQSWQEINASLISLFKMQDIIRYAVTGTILMVAGFGIYNILNIAITQKRKEIDILRSMGFEGGDIVNIFLLQGIILGSTGGILGLLLGALVCTRLEQVSFNNPLMETDSQLMTVSYDPSIYIIGFILAFAATVVASVIPARSAGRLSPIDVIRGE